MTCNVGGVDRALRIIIGIPLLVIGIILLSGVWKWVAIVLGVIGTVTGLVRFCPLNSLLGINSCKPKEAQAS